MVVFILASTLLVLKLSPKRRLLYMYNLLILNVFQGLSSKEAELLKDGTSAEKSCGCVKQGPTSTDLAKSINLPVSESDTPSSSNPPPQGPESQPKMETDTTLTSAGTSKNHMLRIGMPLEKQNSMSLKICA